MNVLNCSSGYVALAVASANGDILSKELNTNLGTDREANMVQFAVEALELLKEFIVEQGNNQ